MIDLVVVFVFIAIDLLLVLMNYEFAKLERWKGDRGDKFSLYLTSFFTIFWIIMLGVDTFKLINLLIGG